VPARACWCDRGAVCVSCDREAVDERAGRDAGGTGDGYACGDSSGPLEIVVLRRLVSIPRRLIF
jgi:hypothetical protein